MEILVGVFERQIVSKMVRSVVLLCEYSAYLVLSIHKLRYTIEMSR